MLNHRFMNRWQLVILTGFVLLYLVVMISRIDISSIDYAEGVRTYISGRILSGGRLYTEILMPHTPVSVLLGAALLKAYHSVITLKVFNIVLHLANIFLVFYIAMRLYNDRNIALLSGLILLILPYSFYHARVPLMDSLLNFFSLLALLCFVSLRPRDMIFAGGFSVLAHFTKVVYFPLLVFNVLYLVATKRIKLAKYYLASTASVGGAIFLVLYSVYGTPRVLTGDTLLQASSAGVPLSALSLGLSRLLRIMSEEGPFVLLFLTGMYLWLEKVHNDERYLIFYALSSFAMSMLLMLNPGTGHQTFYTVEPTVALFSSYALSSILKGKLSSLFASLRAGLDPSAVIKFAVLSLGLVLLLSSPVGSDFQIFRTNNSREISRLVSLLETHTGPNEEVMAPAYVAFVSQRKLYRDIAETYVWWLRYHDGDPDAVELVQSIVGHIQGKSLGVILLDPWLEKMPPIYAAIEQSYQFVYQVGTIRVYFPK